MVYDLHEEKKWRQIINQLYFMADDQIWDYVESFLEGDISREAFWELVKFKYPTHQIAFCTQKALACLTFERSYEI